MNVIYVLRYCLLLALILVTNACLAGIQVGATRIIFPATDREASVQVRNEGVEDTMIQSWIEAAPGQESAVPFAITPSLARLGQKKQQALRIFYQGKGLPLDRESVFWLNIQEIPQVSNIENSLQVAFRQRMKLFYRPTSLPGTPDDAAKEIKWKVLNTSGTPLLLADNPSAFHISFGEVTLHIKGKAYVVKTEMLAPRTSISLKIKELLQLPNGKVTVQWTSINDYGALIKHSSDISM